MPIWPALSVNRTRLRVKNGACAPQRFSSILSRPATGIARIEVITGVLEVVKNVMVVGSSFGMKLEKRALTH
jgi:hypothetical protein